MTTITFSTITVSYFIAVPGDDQASGIFGIGTSHERAVQDAYAQSGTHEPTVRRGEDGQWIVATGYAEDVEFAEHEESEARDYASQKGFIARECTERLYRHIEKHGCYASHFRWSQTVCGLDDLEIEDEAA